MKTIENLILPHTLTIINDSEFYQNSLKSIILSSNVETIGEYQEALTDLLWNQLMADNKVTTRIQDDVRYQFSAW